MKGITQQDLFIKTGIQQWKISNFERGIIPINNEEKARIVLQDFKNIRFLVVCGAFNNPSLEKSLYETSKLAIG